MRTHTRRTWPNWLAVAVLMVLGFAVLDGAVGGIVAFAAFAALIATCFHALAGEEVQDGGGWIGGIGGMM